MKTPLPGFVRTLKSYNKDLRVRWSFERQKWVVECKADRPEALPKPSRSYEDESGNIKEVILPEKSDRYIGYHDGYYPVYYLKDLTIRVLNQLAASDKHLFKDHSPMALARRVEEEEQKSEARKERWHQSESFAHSNEVYDYMANRGSRAFPGGTSL